MAGPLSTLAWKENTIASSTALLGIGFQVTVEGCEHCLRPQQRFHKGTAVCGWC